MGWHRQRAGSAGRGASTDPCTDSGSRLWQLQDFHPDGRVFKGDLPRCKYALHLLWPLCIKAIFEPYAALPNGFKSNSSGFGSLFQHVKKSRFFHFYFRYFFSCFIRLSRKKQVLSEINANLALWVPKLKRTVNSAWYIVCRLISRTYLDGWMDVVGWAVLFYWI